MWRLTRNLVTPIALLLLAASACRDSTDPFPQPEPLLGGLLTGDIAVTTATSGGSLDADGYTATLDLIQSQPAPTNAEASGTPRPARPKRAASTAAVMIAQALDAGPSALRYVRNGSLIPSSVAHVTNGRLWLLANSAPPHLKATFFAVMASFTNLALSASSPSWGPTCDAPSSIVTSVCAPSGANEANISAMTSNGAPDPQPLAPTASTALRLPKPSS